MDRGTEVTGNGNGVGLGYAGGGSDEVEKSTQTTSDSSSLSPPPTVLESTNLRLRCPRHDCHVKDCYLEHDWRTAKPKQHLIIPQCHHLVEVDDPFLPHGGRRVIQCEVCGTTYEMRRHRTGGLSSERKETSSR